MYNENKVQIDNVFLFFLNMKLPGKWFDIENILSEVTQTKKDNTMCSFSSVDPSFDM